MTRSDVITRDRITAKTAWLYRLFTLGAKCVSLTGDTLLIHGPLGGGVSKMPVGTIDSITVSPSWFWHRLTIGLSDGTKRSVGGLDEKEAERVRDGVIGEAARVAKEISICLKMLDERLHQHFASDGYARYSHAQKLHKALVPVLRGCKGLIRRRLDAEAAAALRRLAPLEEVEGFETVRRHANNLFISKSVPVVQAAAKEILSNPLTEEQAEAVATDEDATLVLAGAGTGKTSVIVAKVAHLVRNEDVRPEEVLVLAFNRKAAEEIRARLKGDLFSAHVHTFHSFGRRVIAESEAAPTISKLAEDDSRLRRAIDKIIGDLLNDPRQSKAVINFIIYHHAPYRSAFDFDTHEEYEEYIREIELRTLSGDLVKSFEELEIANYLTEHGVEFRYEVQYEVRTATRRHRQYQPDFFLPRYCIYIEHFALDQEGRPPPAWTGYAEGVEWKRRTHTQHDSTLIETYSWQHRQGVLLETMRRRLEEGGVPFRQVPRHTPVRRLAQEKTSWLAGIVATFLNHAKSGGLSSDNLRSRARHTGDRRRNEGFLDVFDQVRVRYRKLLDDEKAVDFHDLINLAAEHMLEGRWKSRYRYVLVDEFQDISAGRVALIQALGGQDTAYFLVGDDWQSIYRFAGSDVGLLRGCSHILGHVEERTLSQTFRFANGILDPSTEFVKRNPEQTQRSLFSASAAEDGGVTVVADSSSARGAVRALHDIEANAGGQRRSVLVLGRYRQRRGGLSIPARKRSLRVEFNTVHAAKGGEADYVLVLDLKDGRWGFPSQVEGDPLLELVLPPVLEEAYPFAEERRLFYVAMTRARVGVYLVTDPVHPSAFVTELLRESGGLRQIGEIAPKCPRCRRGVLQVMNGRYGPFWGCTEYRSRPSCRYKQDIERGTAIGRI